MHSHFHRATKRLTGFAAILGSCVGLLVAGNLQAADVPTIAAKLLERQKSVRTASFTWRELQTYPKNSIVEDLKGLSGPPEDETVEKTTRLLLDSTIGAGRYETDGRQWSFIEMGFVPLHLECIVSGEVVKEFIAGGAGKHGSIRKIQWGQRGGWFMPVSSPCLLSFRAQDPVLGNFDAAKWAVDSVGKDAEGRMTVVIATRSKTESKELLTFLDDGSFPLTRIEHQYRGKTTLLTDIKNVADEKAGCVPDTWVVTLFNGDGSLRFRTEAKMDSYEINPKIAPALFDIEYPAGTRVNDQIRGEVYSILPDGSREPIRRTRGG